MAHRRLLCEISHVPPGLEHFQSSCQLSPGGDSRGQAFGVTPPSAHLRGQDDDTELWILYLHVSVCKIQLPFCSVFCFLSWKALHFEQGFRKCWPPAFPQAGNGSRMPSRCFWAAACTAGSSLCTCSSEPHRRPIGLDTAGPAEPSLQEGTPGCGFVGGGGQGGQDG